MRQPPATALEFAQLALPERLHERAAPLHAGKRNPTLPNRLGWAVMEAPPALVLAIFFVLEPHNRTPGMMALGSLIALLTLGLWTGYQFQKAIRSDVLDKVGNEPMVILSPPPFASPEEMAAFLDETISKEAVIETWERELSIFTDHNYHFPDQSLLAQAHVAKYRRGPKEYLLGEEYFSSFKPSYVVIGWYARFTDIYDVDFLSTHGRLIRSIGGNQWRYDVYELDVP